METPHQHYLARRGNWQLVANQGGALAETETADVLRKYLETTYPGTYEVVKHPDDLDQLYYEYTRELNPTSYERPAAPGPGDVWFDELKGVFLTLAKSGKEIYAKGGGCIPDIRITHIASKKCCFLECKNQNDAGNAHERAAKYATPSVVSFIQKKLGVEYHPIGHLFTGAMVENRKYVVELATTYGFAPNHLFLWKKDRPIGPLLEWIEHVILPPLRD